MPGHRFRLTALALAICTVLGPSLAANAAESGDVSLLDRFRRAPSEGNVNRELALLADGQGDPAEHALRAMVSAGLSLGGLNASVDHGCVFEETEALSPGDLTGDGLDDVLEYAFLIDFCEWTLTSSVSALSGSNGQVLWSEAFGDFGVLFPAGDLDGAPGADLIAFTIDAQLAPGVYDWSLRYRGLSGATGDELWTRSYRDPWTEAYVGPTAAFAEIDFTIPFGLADATGDNRADLLVGRFNSALAYDEATQMGGGGSAALFEIVSGANGLPAAEFPATGQGGYPSATFMPDGNGDGLTDVAAVSVEVDEDGGFTADVVAHAGKTGAPLWSAGVGLASAPSVQGVELDGDGKGDVVLTAIDWEGFGDEGATEIATLFGTDLSSVRMRIFGTDGLGFPEPVPNVMGAGTQDLLLLREHEDWTMSASLLDGAWDTSLPAMIGWSVSGEYVDLAGDATGDGKEDVVVYDSTYDDWSDEYIETTRVISGSNGRAAWTHSVRESDPYTFLLATEADGNASGTADFALIGEGGDGDEYVLVEGANGSSLWARTRRVGGYLYSLHPGLLEGQGDDLLESVETDGGFKTGARRGESGALLWRR